MNANIGGTTRTSPQFFTIAQVADMCQVSQKTIYRCIKAGDLIAHRFKGRLRISAGGLQAFIKLGRQI